MTIVREKDFLTAKLIEIAKLMLVAARTAPKGRGFDRLHTAIVYGEEMIKIADTAEQIGKANNVNFLIRDAENLRKSECLVLLGSEIAPLNLGACGYCGFSGCEEKSKNPNHPCTFNSIDLGIALGSAVSVAANHKVDNRIMYSLGVAAKAIGIFDEKVKIVFAIPLSVSAKSPFFDR